LAPIIKKLIGKKSALQGWLFFYLGTSLNKVVGYGFAMKCGCASIQLTGLDMGFVD